MRAWVVCVIVLVVGALECPPQAHHHPIAETSATSRLVAPEVYQFAEHLRQFRAPSRAPTSLRYRDDGTFRIAIFTDLHYGEGEDTTWGPWQDENSSRAMRAYLHYERPDMVVFDGDQITGNNILYNATTYWNMLLQPCIEADTPWAIVFGNHDDLSAGPGETRADLMAFDSSYELSFSQAGPEDIEGVSNYYVPIMAPGNASEPVTWLYFLDSGGGQEQPSQIFPDQIAWYQNTSSSLRAAHGLLPALAFFHIPLPESMTAWNTQTCYGTKNESVVCQDVDTGVLDAFVQQGDVRATFSGHNHLNDYCCPLHGVELCYARHSGYGGYGPHAPWIQGSRIVEMNLDSSSNWTWSSWIRLEDGTKLDKPPQHTPCSDPNDNCSQKVCSSVLS